MLYRIFLHWELCAIHCVEMIIIIISYSTSYERRHFKTDLVKAYLRNNPYNNKLTILHYKVNKSVNIK